MVVLRPNYMLVFTGIAAAKEKGATLRSGPELEIRFGIIAIQSS